MAVVQQCVTGLSRRQSCPVAATSLLFSLATFEIFHFKGTFLEKNIFKDIFSVKRFQPFAKKTNLTSGSGETVQAVLVLRRLENAP